jgi:hypothetical protein
VVYKDTNGAWRSSAARYLAPAANRYEGWAFDLEPSSEFALSCTVNGQTSWDNNGGTNDHLQPFGTEGRGERCCPGRAW